MSRSYSSHHYCMEIRSLGFWSKYNHLGRQCGMVGLEWEEAEVVETPGLWTNKSRKLSRCVFCHCGMREPGDSRSTVKKPSRTHLRCWGWREGAPCKRVFVRLGVAFEQSLQCRPHWGCRGQRSGCPMQGVAVWPSQVRLAAGVCSRERRQQPLQSGVKHPQWITAGELLSRATSEVYTSLLPPTFAGTCYSPQ